jgi:hypothetical protein
MLTQADYLVKSGFLPKAINSKEKAVAVMMMGRELGIEPMQSFQGIDIIEGRPAVRPQLRLALAKRSGLMENFSISFSPDGTSCTVTGNRKGDKPHTVTFGKADADKAGLTGKYNWKNYPKNMLQWRAVGYWLDAVMPDVCGGYYSADELGAVTDAEGAPLEIVPEVVQEETPPAPQVDAHKQRIIDLWIKTKNRGIKEKEWREFMSRSWDTEKATSLTDAQLDIWQDLLANTTGKEDLMSLMPQMPEEIEADIIDAEYHEDPPVQTAPPTTTEKPNGSQAAGRVRRGI